MIKKKVFGIMLISITGGSLAFAAISSFSSGVNPFLGKGFDGHNSSCHWNHYNEYSATIYHSGCAEFWACCSHPGNHVLTAPSEGQITDIGYYTGALDSSDDRYIPKIERTNSYVSLDNIDWQSTSLLYTPVQYSNISSVTLKMRVSGSGDLTGIWTAIGVGVDGAYDGDNPIDPHSDWHNLIMFNYVNDGEWHLYTIKDLSLASGYVNFCHNLDHPIDATFDIDDIRIDYNGTSVTETFEDENNCLFTLDQNHAHRNTEIKKNNYLRVDPKASYDDSALLYTLEQYTNVTNVSYSFRANNVTTKKWQGVSVNSVAFGVDQYTNRFENTGYADDGEWHIRSHDVSNKTGYVNFINECGNLVADSFDFDNIVITYNNGQTKVFTFDDGEVLGTQAKYQRVTVVNEEYSNALGVTALDANKTVAENREYVPTFTASKGSDAQYGPYVQLDNWNCASNQNRCWIGLTQTTPLAVTENELGTNVDSYWFYMYNPLNSEFEIQIMFEHNYHAIARRTLAAHAWTKVELPVGSYIPEGKTTPVQLTEAHQIGIDHAFSSQGANVGSGWKITSIYADPSMDKFARLDAGSYGESVSAIYTSVQYTGVSSISFKMRVTGSAKPDKNPWMGFGIYETHSLYHEMHNVNFSFDNQWHNYTISDISADGYVNFIQASGEFAYGSMIDIDDVVITYNGGQTITEDFNHPIIFAYNTNFVQLLAY